MHGRVKVRQNEEQKKIENIKKLEKAKEFIKLEAECLKKYENQSLDYFALSSTLLEMSPNSFLYWNLRKELIIKLAHSLDSTKAINEELILTKRCIMKDPKSYSSWHHRLWAVEHFLTADLKYELSLCNEMLQLDERNFHCWDYRRSIVKRLDLDPKEDLKFTGDLLDINFSNFSAWHYRSEILASLNPNQREIFQPSSQELDLVHSAIFTDPNDQSAWFYYWRLFVDRSRSTRLESVYFPTSRPNKVFISLSRAVGGEWVRENLDLKSENGSPLILSPVDASLSSHVYVADVATPLIYNSSDSIKAQPRYQIETGGLMPESNFTISPNIDRTLVEEEYAMMKELLEMEPTNKWVLLTMLYFVAFLRTADYLGTIASFIETLKRIDKQSIGFYNDLSSEILIQNAISKMEGESIDLSSLGLASLSNLKELVHLERIDLSSNNLRSLPDSVVHLQSCQTLILDGNPIETLSNLHKIPVLKCVSLKNCQISHLEQLKGLEECLNHELAVDLSSNALKREQLSEEFAKINISF